MFETNDLEAKQALDVDTLREHTRHGELDSILLIERLNNPVIRKQVNDLIEKVERSQEGEIRSRVILDENGKQKRLPNGKLAFVDRVYVPKTREQIEADFDKYLDEITTKTRITFNGSVASHPKKMSPNWKNPVTGEAFTVEQLASAEAHEKGHLMRPYRSKYLDALFGECFDKSKAEFSFDDYIALYSKEERSKIGFEDAKRDFYRYLFNASEIAERMGQLKNYFGMRGDEVFTKAHLEYARVNYVKDVGFDNRMSPFFAAITPEKEEGFLKLINSAGI